MRTLILTTVNMNTKLEMPSFTHFRDMIGAKKFKSGLHDPDNTYFGFFVILRLYLLRRI